MSDDYEEGTPLTHALRQAAAAVAEASSGSVRVEMAILFRELSVLLRSGILVPDALQMLAASLQHPRLVKALAGTFKVVQEGSPMSLGLRLYPRLFPPSVVELVDVGEQSGRLPDVVGRIATYLEKHVELSMKVRSALTYPLFMAVFCLGVILVVPSLLLDGIFVMLRDMHAEVPLPTQILMGLCALTRHPLSYAIAGAGGTFGYLAYQKLMEVEKNRLTRDRWILELRVVGPVLRAVGVAEFCLALETMVSSGLPILQSMRSAARVCGNLALQHAVEEAAKAVSQGAPLHEALSQNKLFPPALTYLLAAGEECGDIGRVLERFARLTQEDIDDRLRAMVAALEPTIILVMGVIVGGITIATLAPLMKVLEKLAL